MFNCPRSKAATERTRLLKKSAANSIWLYLSVNALIAVTIRTACAQAPDGSSGAASGSTGMGQSSSGSAGMPDTDAVYKKQVAECAAKGKRSLAYIGSLVNLGMHYNRKNEYENAELALSKALKIIDGGALLPLPGSTAEGPPTITEHADGTVSATINKPKTPYEDTLGDLLPALIKAETECRHWQPAETHVKRLIKMADTNRIIRVPNLMFAYSQYAELLAKQHRNKEAEIYRKKAEAINKSIRPL